MASSPPIFLFQLQNVISGNALSQSGEIGVVNATPGTQPLLIPVDGELDEFITMTGATSSSGYRGYTFGFVGGLVLDVPAYSTANGTFIQLWTVNNGDNQLWTILPNDVGSSYEENKPFKIMNVNSKLVLDNPGGSTITQPVQQWESNTLGFQTWTFVQLDPGLTPQLQINSLGANTFSAGCTVALQGSGFFPNTTYSLWYMNTPFDFPYRAIQLTIDYYLPAGGAGIPGTLTVSSDSAGNISSGPFQLPQFWNAGSNFPQPEGFAVLVLEDGQGNVVAMTVFSQQLFSNPAQG